MSVAKANVFLNKTLNFIKSTKVLIALIAVSPIVSAVPFSNTLISSINTTSTIVANVSKTNRFNKAFTITKIETNNESPASIINTIFQSEYGNNFNNYFTETTAYLDNNQLLTATLECNGSYLLDVKHCDLCMYSNQVSLKRFECININLFKEPNRDEELNTFDLDGFVYIPDYYADKIIKESNGELKTYADLLPNLSTYSPEQRKLFLNKYCIRSKNVNGFHETYKIANIFHVDGFKEKYSYNDDESSAYLKAFLNNYVFVHSSTQIAKKMSKCLITIFDAKKYLIQERIELPLSFVDNNNIFIKCYSVSSNNVSEIKDANIALEQIIAKEYNNFGLLWAIVLTCFFFALEIIICITNIKSSSTITNKTFLITIISTLLIFAILNILMVSAFKLNVYMIRFFNSIFFLNALLSVSSFSGLYFYLRFKHHGD